jgi:hypothetical protein
MITLRRLVPADQPQLRRLWVERWGGETIVAHGTIHSTDGLDGLIAIDRDKWIGLITFLISGQECEIVSFDSLCELIAVHRHAMAEVRQHQPQIPEPGLGGIPLRDEIELELLLDATATYNVP